MKKKAVAIVLMAAMVMSTITACGSSDSASSSDTASSSESTEEDAAGDAGANVESLENADEITSMDASDLDGTTITFWHAMGGVNGEAINTLVEKFNEENEYGITVVAEYQGAYDDEINKLKSAQLGDMGVDLVQIYDIGTRFMIDSGWIVPMQELIDASGFDSSVIEPNIAAYYTVDGTLYSMPFNSSTPILYYNKDMFEAAGIDTVPTTFEEISEAGDKLTESGVDEVISIGIYGWFFEQFVCKQGENYVNNGNGRESYATAVEFDSNGAGLNVLTAWKDLYDKGYAPNVGRSDDNGIADFSAGKSAMTLGSTASLKQILQDVDGKFEVGTAYFPSVTSDTEGGVSIGGGSLWALNNNDDVKKAATWKFIEFLVSAESQAYWNAQTGYFPVTTEAANEQVYKDNMEEYPQFQTAIDQLHDSAPEYAGALLSVFPEARSIVETEIENMLNNGTSPEDTVAAMAEQINSSITDYNDINY